MLVLAYKSAVSYFQKTVFSMPTIVTSSHIVKYIWPVKVLKCTTKLQEHLLRYKTCRQPSFHKLSANNIHILSPKEHDFMTGTLYPEISPPKVILKKLLVALIYI